MDAVPEVTQAYREQLAAEPARTSLIVLPLIRAADAAGIAAEPSSRATWLAKQDLSGTGHGVRLDKLLSIWRDAGLWLHPQGVLESVLGVDRKGVHEARMAAQSPGDIDAVASWCAFRIGIAADLEALLNHTIERIAHEIMQAQRLEPEATFDQPTGSTAEADAKLVDVTPASSGFHRITVKGLNPYNGYWPEFSRETASRDLKLAPGDAKASGEVAG